MPSPRTRIIALMLSGGLLAASGLACHSNSAAPATTPTTPTSGPAVMLSTSSLSFTGLGTQPVTLTNSGTAVLTITSIVAGGNFTETDNCVGSVAVGASCTINVTFVLAVANPGGSAGSVTITDNAADSPESMTLSGPVVSNAVGVLFPTSLTFAAQPMGTPSSAQTVTLTNPANGFSAPLVISQIFTSGDFAVAQSTCPGSLPSGGSCTIGVTFTPTAAGTSIGALNVIDTGVPNIQIAQLSGTGR